MSSFVFDCHVCCCCLKILVPDQDVTSSIPARRRREVESFDGVNAPPPMGHSSMNKKRKCDEKPSPEQVDLTNPSFGNSTSIIPPSINAYSKFHKV